MTDDGVPNFMQALMRDMMSARIVETFGASIRGCMEQEGVNLATSIAVNRQWMEADIEVGGFGPEQAELVREGFNEAAKIMRQALSEAFTLVRLETSGSSEPIPFDAEKHLTHFMETRERTAAFMAQHQHGPECEGED